MTRFTTAYPLSLQTIPFAHLLLGTALAAAVPRNKLAQIHSLLEQHLTICYTTEGGGLLGDRNAAERKRSGDKRWR